METRKEIFIDDVVAALYGKRYRVIIVTLVFAVLGVIYVVITKPTYRASVELVPSESSLGFEALQGALGGLAGMVGLGAGAGGVGLEAVAVLESRGFIADFIRERNLLPVLFADEWDAQSSSWMGPEDEWPDLVDGTEMFVRVVRTVEQDPLTGAVTLSVEWHDPQTAANWANALSERINSVMRDRARRRATANVEYLQREVERAKVVAIREASANLLESELQRLLLVNSGEDAAFRIVDPAVPPKKPIKPRKVLMVAAAMFLGAFFASLWIITEQFMNRVRRHSGSNTFST